MWWQFGSSSVSECSRAGKHGPVILKPHKDRHYVYFFDRAAAVGVVIIALSKSQLLHFSIELERNNEVRQMSIYHFYVIFGFND